MQNICANTGTHWHEWSKQANFFAGNPSHQEVTGGLYHCGPSGAAFSVPSAYWQSKHLGSERMNHESLQKPLAPNLTLHLNIWKWLFQNVHEA